MQVLKTILDQIKQIWQDATGAARLGIALLAVIFVAGIVGVGVWSAQPNYVVLTNDLSPTDAAKVIDGLDSAGISYQIKGSGSIVLVDKTDWSRAKLAMGRNGIGVEETPMVESSIWMDPTTQAEARRLKLEVRLERSIAKINSIEFAEVHLAIPETSSFLRKEAVPSAAVIVELTKGSKFGDSDALLIARFVASSVTNMTEDQVVVSDTTGHQYNGDGSYAGVSNQFELRTEMERRRSAQAREILAPILGAENSRVVVSMDVSFPNGTTTTREVDDDNRVISSEKIEKDETTNRSQAAVGVPGIESNDGSTPPGTRNPSGAISKLDKNETTFDVGDKVTTEVIRDPVVNLMTVSVAINSADLAEGVVPDDLKKRVESLVSQAVGLVPERDQIAVDLFEFVESPLVLEPVATPVPWDLINEILKNVSLGIAALVAGFIALKAFQKFTPDSISETPAAESSSTGIDELTEMVQENPEIFSRIIAAWSESEVNSGSTPESTSQRAA
ncbi:MAG: flagellar M-ring protein FliF C-terminal domain-containing protein [Planctomycetota bacterium]